MKKLNKNSFNQLIKKANNNNINAQFQLAEIYYDGLKTKTLTIQPDKQEAYKWFEKASLNGDPSALNNLGNMLFHGIGCRKNIPKAIQVYQTAIAKGYSASALNLGSVYRDKKDFKAAFEYYLLAAKLAKINYSLTIGLCYYTGLGVETNKKKALKIFEKVASEKHEHHSQQEIDEANYLLGLSYMRGDGIKKSLKKALEYLKLANKMGDHPGSDILLSVLG